MKTLIFLCFLFLGLIAQGQISDLPNVDSKIASQNEIGVNFYNITAHPFYTSYYQSFQQNIFVGLMYKRHYKKNALRVGIDYYHSKFSYELYSNFNDEGKNNVFQIRAGIERKFISKKLEPYAAVDFTFSYGDINGIRDGIGDFPGTYFYHPYDITITEYGLAPALGIKYRIQENLSLAIESNGSLILYSLAGLDYDYSGVGFKLIFNPVRLLSINYHF